MSTIVISSNTSWSVYNFRLNLARSLKANGHNVIIVAPRDKYSVKIEKEFSYVDIYLNPRSINPLKDLYTLMSFYILYKKLNPDIILNFTIKVNIYSGIIGRWLGIPVINNVTGLGSLFTGNVFIRKLVVLLYKYSFARSKKIFFQNRDDLYLFKSNSIITGNNVDILPGSGVDINKFSYSPKLPGRNIIFLFIGRLLIEKGIKDYVEASKILKAKYDNLIFWVLGVVVDSKDGVGISQINVWEKDGLIKYLGVTDNVKSTIEQADCVVLPSYYREGVPRSLLESASVGRPIITTNSIGCKETVDNGINGYLCATQNPQDLARKMEQFIMLDNISKQKMGRNGRIKAEKNFDESIIIQKYLDAVRAL